MKTLTRWETRWAVAALGAIFPKNAHDKIALGVADLDVEGYLRDLLGRVSLRVALGLHAAIWIVALAPLFVIGRWATIASLPPDARETVVARLSSSPIYVVRQLTMLLKTLGAILFTGEPAVREVMLRARPVVVPAESGPRLIQLGRKVEAEEEEEVPHEDEQSVA
jgi:hypothetical protein